MALHFWYSAFVPIEYHDRLLLVLTDFIKTKLKAEGPSQLSPTSMITLDGHRDFFRLVISPLVQSTYQIGDAANELHRVR